MRKSSWGVRRASATKNIFEHFKSIFQIKTNEKQSRLERFGNILFNSKSKLLKRVSWIWGISKLNGQQTFFSLNNFFMKNVLETKNITPHLISSENFNEFLSLTLFDYDAIKIVFVLEALNWV